MTVFSNDPLRCKITKQDILRLIHRPGIDSCFHPTEQKDEYYCKLVASDINPYSPEQEHYKEDIERELAKLNIVQDHIREFKPFTYFNSRKNRVIATILDEKIFGKENRYDVLLDKVQEVHRLKNGKLFGIIENS